MQCMPPLPSSFTLAMPGWFEEVAAALPDHLPDLEARMAAVNAAARRNVDEGTGGPFAAGVFERDSGRVVSLGVNRVVPATNSCAHAETMALGLAQAALGTWDLGGADLPAHQLVVNWRPCAMCFGSVVWSGVADLVIAGEGELVEQITGFDEGPIHPAWRDELAARGIGLTVGVGHDDAVATFEAYRDSGAPVYNGRSGSGA
jgi:tRNA(Arg) A34 adenosine deaminase TadA